MVVDCKSRNTDFEINIIKGYIYISKPQLVINLLTAVILYIDALITDN